MWVRLPPSAPQISGNTHRAIIPEGQARVPLTTLTAGPSPADPCKALFLRKGDSPSLQVEVGDG
jgi:hypothetical protein